MKVSIVILNWNGEEFLRKYLPSVIRFSDFSWAEIVIADNGSTDNSETVVKNEFPTVKYLQLDKNYGFAEGYNRALATIDADYFLLLNSDIEVTEGWFKPLVEIMDSDDSIGACQPKIMCLNNRDTFEYAGAGGGFIDKYGYPFCRGRILNELEKDEGQYNDSGEIFWASGACMLVRAKLWRDMNGFDSDFWAHMEEIDMCWRMKNRGYKVMYAANSIVYHLGGGSLSYGNPLKIYLNFRNNLFLLYKNLPKKNFARRIFTRMILDGIAAMHFLSTGEFKAFKKVFAAHISFYKSLKAIKKKRRELLTKVKKDSHNEIFPNSLIWNFYIKRIKKFSELKWGK
jgi:hypothetical protein